MLCLYTKHTNTKTSYAICFLSGFKAAVRHHSCWPSCLCYFMSNMKTVFKQSKSIIKRFLKPQKASWILSVLRRGQTLRYTVKRPALVWRAGAQGTPWRGYYGLLPWSMAAGLPCIYPRKEEPDVVKCLWRSRFRGLRDGPKVITMAIHNCSRHCFDSSWWIPAKIVQLEFSCLQYNYLFSGPFRQNATFTKAHNCRLQKYLRHSNCFSPSSPPHVVTSQV